MITTQVRNLLTAVICLFAGATAQAQFTGGIEQYPTNDYKTKAVSFKLSEVAATLETDAATLAEAYTTWLNAEEAEENMLFLVNPDGTLAEDYSANGKGFYITSEGAYGVWARDDAATAGTWFASATANADNDEFTFNIGQYPDTLKVGDKVEANFLLKYNGKEAKFLISLSVIAMPDYEIPEPATLIEKELNVVGSAETTVEQYPRVGYDSDGVSMQIGDAIAKLGLKDGQMLADVLDKLLYCTEYNNGDVEQGGGLKKDSLTNQSSAGVPGFWLRAVMDENGELTNECCRAGYSNEDYFFAEAFAYDPETGDITCNIGQYPSKLAANNTYFVNCYLVYGDKAYKLTYNLKILEREAEGLEGMTEVGKDEVVIEQYPRTSYDADDFNVDVEAIAAALGCEVGNFSMQALDGDENFAAGPTAGNQGYWFNSEGYVTAWEAQPAFYIENPTANDFSVLRIGQYPNKLKVGDEVSTNLYFINGDNYYTLHVALNILDEGDKPDPNEFKNLGTKSFVFQQEPQSDYVWTDGIDIPTDFLYEKLGEDATWKVYGLAVLNEDGSEPDPKYVNNYTITEAPGFWLNKDGRNSGWGENAIFGISAGGRESGKFTMLQYPNRCSIGDVLKTQLFFVNEAKGEMVTFNFTYQIVEEVKTYEQVGQSGFTVPVDWNEETEFEIPDMAVAAEALGVSVDDLLSENNYCWYGMTSDGIYAEGKNASAGLSFNIDGGYDANGAIFFYDVKKDGDAVKAVVATDLEVEDDYAADGQFCLRVGDKEFVYAIRFVSPALYTGISNANVETKADGRIYDLSGRQVTKPVRGLYIQNGKKFVVK